jgi:putative CocE/NonD family hydrolase
MYRPPHLTAMFADVGGASLIDEFGHPGGIPNLGWARWLLASAASSPAAARDPELRKPLTDVMQNPQTWLALDRSKRGEILAKFPAHARAYADWYAHPAEDDYWRQKGFYTRGNYKLIKDVPIYFVTGWYDYFAEGVLENFAALAKLHKTPKKLMVGPWPHGTGGAECGNAAFGPDARLDKNALMADWFGHWLKDREYAVVRPETVRLFRMGGGAGDRSVEGRLNHGGAWFTSAAWPPKAEGRKRFYLRSGGALGEKEAAASQANWAHDPASPVPSVGGRYGNCVQDQGVNRRADVLSYVSEPLAKAFETTGAVTARLSVRSDAPESDFIVKVMDVYPDGYSMILAEGQLRARGPKNELTISAGSVSNLFAVGHRVRVDLSSSNFPRSEPNAAKANNGVVLGGANASYIEFPESVLQFR